MRERDEGIEGAQISKGLRSQVGVSWVLAPSSLLAVTFDEPPGDELKRG